MPKNQKQKETFKSLKGMQDLLLTDFFYFQKISKIVEKFANFYNFFRIETPILEKDELFKKTINEISETIYTFRTRGGQRVSLKPEGTVPICRAYLQYNMEELIHPVKLYYISPFFRYQKIKHGKLRQFHQFGFESIGEKDPIIDAQIILIFYSILKGLDIQDLIIEVNSMGDSVCVKHYKKFLSNFLKSYSKFLCNDCKIKIRENPIKILACQNEECQKIVSQTPQILDHLCEECHNHFKEVLEILDELNLPYRLNPLLIKNFNYYTKTVFEIYKKEGDFKINLSGGGRYDDLIKLLSGKNGPACGGAAIIEKIVEELKKKKIKTIQKKYDLFFAQIGNIAKRRCLKVLDQLKKERVSIVTAFEKKNLRVQLKIAEQLKVKYCLILGQKEALDNTIIVRKIKTGSQKIIPIKRLPIELKRIKKR